MYQEYQQTDLAQELSQLTLLPPSEMELTDILQEITKITGHYSNIKKFSIRNVYVIGTWLEAAFTKFDETKANRLSGNFEDWLNVNTNLKKSKANDLRNFAKLAKTIPKILNCNALVIFFPGKAVTCSSPAWSGLYTTFIMERFESWGSTRNYMSQRRKAALSIIGRIGAKEIWF